MRERITVRRGSDWCTLQISSNCLTRFDRRPLECFLLGGQVRIFDPCLRELHMERFSEDYEWAFREAPHEGFCESATIHIGSEEIRFCPKCFLEVLKAFRQLCTCFCHRESGSCDGHPFVCQRCGTLSRIDTIYMTRPQKERHPKES